MTSGTFYAAVLSTAATLMGLLFFAVLFNVDKRGHKLGPRWLSLAKSTINVYVILTLYPLVFLLPDLSDGNRSLIILVLTAFSIGRQVVCWSSTWRLQCGTTKHVSWRVAWLLLAPISAFAVIADTAAGLLWGGHPFHHDRTSLALLLLFIVALRNSWNLVLDHARICIGGEANGFSESSAQHRSQREKAWDQSSLQAVEPSDS